jgi:hypothetical protein
MFDGAGKALVLLAGVIAGLGIAFGYLIHG